MIKEKYIKALVNPNSIKQNEVSDLKKVIEKFPFFQSARALYLKGLQKQKSFKYNNTLKTTAAYTADRNVLFSFIIHNNFLEKTKEKPENKQYSNLTLESNIETEKNTLDIAKKKLTIGKPIPFNSNEKHSFNQWLQLGTIKPIKRREETKQKENSEKSKQNEIINKFILANPKIPKIDKNLPLEIEPKKAESNPQKLMTETLAKVYLEQKKYDSAIKAYEILSLKYPKKSSFFANQIKLIKILSNK